MSINLLNLGILNKRSNLKVVEFPELLMNKENGKIERKSIINQVKR